MKVIIERIWGKPRYGSWSSQTRITNVEDGFIRVDGIVIDFEKVYWLSVTRDDGRFRLSPVSHLSRHDAVRKFGQKVIDARFPVTITKIPWITEHVISGPDPLVFPDYIIGTSAFTGASKRPPQQLEIGFEWQRLLILR